MRITLLAVFLSLGISAIGQYSDLVFYSIHGNSFYVYLNGNLQNQIAAPMVKVTHVTAPNYKLEIEFKNPRFARIERDLFITPGLESDYEIVKNEKGFYECKFVVEVFRVNDTIDLKYRQIVKYINTPERNLLIEQKQSTTETQKKTFTN